MTNSQGIARHVSRARTERLVAVTRLIGNVCGVIAAAVTARDYGTFVPLGLLLPWSVLSAVLVWDTHRRGRLFRPPLLLALDLLITAVVIALTGGGASPFFPFLLITPFGAANLYGRRGMLWAGCGTLATYVAIVLLATEQGAVDPRLMIIRVGVLVLIAVVMIRRADHEQRTSADLERLAANEERLRLSRDLHDGLLQTLGGLALHVRAARRALAGDPRGADRFSVEQRLDLVVEQLIEAQRALRDFVDGLRPELLHRRVAGGAAAASAAELDDAASAAESDGGRSGHRSTPESLRARLLHAAHSIELHWNVAVACEAADEVDAVPARLADDVVALLTEALTNAARHARATRIRAAVVLEEDAVRIDVQDDGRGFPFQGRYDLAQLVATGHAPWSLRERVTALGGDLVIDSSPRGARVEIRLPAAS